MGFKNIQKKLNGDLREVSELFQGCFKEVLGCFK